MFKMLQKTFFIHLFVLKFYCVSPLNILGVFSDSGKSHYNVFQPILGGLANKGHSVTVLGYRPFGNKRKNYRDVLIGVSSVFPLILNATSTPQKLEPNRRSDFYKLYYYHASTGTMYCKEIFESIVLREFLKGNQSFDVVIIEQFNVDCLLYLGKHFNCPIVRIDCGNMLPFVPKRYGNPLNPAYMPSNFLPVTGKMSFFERLENTLVALIVNIYYNHIRINDDNNLLGIYFGEAAKTLNKDIFNESLILMNTHFTISGSKPLVPNIVEIGGSHIGEAQPLTQVRGNCFCINKHFLLFYALIFEN